MSGWISFDEDGDIPAFKTPATTAAKGQGEHSQGTEQQRQSKNSQSWVKFEGSPAAATSTPTAQGQAELHRPVVPQHTGGSSADVTSQASDDHQSVVASSIISSRGSFSGSHDNISSSREYMPLESSSPKPGTATPSSEGWVRFGDSKRITSSTPNKVASDRVFRQNGISGTTRVSSPPPANWVQFDDDEHEVSLSSTSSRPSPALSSSRNNSLSLESPVNDHHTLDANSPVAVREQTTNIITSHDQVDGRSQREPLKVETTLEHSEKQLSRTTPLHMTDHANDMEVSMLSAIEPKSETVYESMSPGNPFKEDVLTIKQLEKQKIMDEQFRRTVSPYNPFINMGPSAVQNIMGKTNASTMWTTFDEADGAPAQKTLPSPGNPFAGMTTAANVHNRPNLGQPYNLTPQGNVNVTSSAVVQQATPTQQSLRQVVAVQPLPQSTKVQESEQRTSALLSPDSVASQPVSPFSMKPNQWQQQQQFFPTSQNSSYTQSRGVGKQPVAAIVAQTTSASPFADSSKSQLNTRSSIKSNTQSTLSDDRTSVLEDQFPREQVDLSEGWPLKLRCPDKKKLAGSRNWQPVHVRLSEGNVLQLFSDSTRQEPFRELPLQSNYELGSSNLQQFDTKGKIHTIKLFYVSYKEKRKVSAKSLFEKEGHYEQLMKLGSLDFKTFRSFVYTINDALMKLTLYHDRGAHYHQDMISVVVSDECRCLVSAKGDVTKQTIMVNLNILAFLSASPDCAIGLNDVQVKGVDVVARQHIIPNKTSDWIRLHNVELHKCANRNVFVDSRMIEFQPLNASMFRLMQFQVTPPEEQDLPLAVKAVFSGEGTHMDLRVDLLVPACTGRKNPAHYLCENICVYLPIPEKWISYFRKPKRMGQSSIHAVNKRAEAIKRGCLLPKLLEISVGSAKYEHAFRAVVWRIDKLPEKSTGHPSTHLLKCHLNLTTTKEVPRTMTRPVEVEYHTAHTTASKTTVRSLAVSSEKSPEKRIRYRASYEYQVHIEENYTRISDSERDEEVSCLQQ